MADDSGGAGARLSASPLERRLTERLEQLRAADLYRVRRVIEGAHGVRLRVDGRDCLNFCSNDYLGLAADPRVARAAQAALGDCGTGSGASALISGYNRQHRLLEDALAEFTGYPRVLLFTSGWAANCGVLRALLGRGDSLIADELNHASLIDGGRLSGARYRRVRHGDATDFEAALAESTGGQALMVTDSVFSMDGDVAPLRELAALRDRSGAALMVDDAHGLGVLGPRGQGAPARAGGRPDIYVATLGKSLGAAGAFVAGSETLIEFLIQRARSWVFSTAPPPAIAAAAREALRILRDEPEHRQQLLDNIARFVNGARQLDIPLGAPGSTADALGTAIMPLVLGESAQAMRASRALFEKGIWVAGIRPPTVPAGTARLRMTLSATHRADDIDRLLEALAGCGLSRMPRPT